MNKRCERRTWGAAGRFRWRRGDLLSSDRFFFGLDPTLENVGFRAVVEAGSGR